MGSSGDVLPTSSELNPQKYNLRWHDYPQSVVTSFRHLKEDEDFVDVTLACNSQQFTAHKVVLSACSPYFKKLLKVRMSSLLDSGLVCNQKSEFPNEILVVILRFWLILVFFGFFRDDFFKLWM